MYEYEEFEDLTADEKELLETIRKQPDPGRALEIAVQIILDYLEKLP